MKKNSGFISFLAVELIVLIVFNLLAFVIPFNRTPTFWFAYVFTMAAILISFGTSFYAFSGSKRSKFYGISLIYISWIYLVVQVGVGILFMSLSTVPYQVPLLLCSIIMAAYLVGMIASDSAKEYIEEIDRTIKQKTFFIRSIQLDLQELFENASDPALQAQMKNLIDEVKCSDPVSIDQLSDMESRIEERVNTLSLLMEAGNNAEALHEAKEIRKQIERRNEKMKLLK